MAVRHIHCEGVGEDVELIAHICEMPHMLHLVISVANKPFVIQRRSVPALQKVIGLLLVVGKAAELRDGNRAVQREPVLVDQQLSLTANAIAHMRVAAWLSHEAFARIHTFVEGGKGGGVQVASSMMKGGITTHMAMGFISLIRVVLKKNIGMTTAEKPSDRREGLIV